LPCTNGLTRQDLGGITLPLGVFCYISSASLSGILTLDAEGDSNAQFIVQIESSFTTLTASSVLLFNCAQACNVFYALGASATIGAGSAFAGNILATTSISSGAGADVQGGLYALIGSVTLVDNTVAAQDTSIVVVLPPRDPVSSVTPLVSIPETVTPTLPAVVPTTSVTDVFVTLVPSVTLPTGAWYRP